MRHAVLSIVCLLAGCPAGFATEAQPGNDVINPVEPLRGCADDLDCATAASTCCACPEFAVSTQEPSVQACAGVSCPGQSACADNVRAACDRGACVLACVPMACPADCAAGYAIDPTGCLSCACDAPVVDGCTEDTDCVQTRADCCGCDQGGADTAVRAAEQAAYDAMLACAQAPACPAIDVCEPGAVPRCLQGRCELSQASSLPPGACGTAELLPCPTGTVCTVNASDEANLQGVGLCMPP